MSARPVVRRLWIPVPVTAAQVRVVLDSGSHLDALEEALLGLLRVAPRDARELARKLRVSISLIHSALAGLADRELVSPPDEAAGLYMCAREDQLVLAAVAQAGWIFHHVDRILPTIMLGERVPSSDRHRPREGVIGGDGARVAARPPRAGELASALQTLLAARDVQVLRPSPRPEATPARDVEVGGERLPSLTQAARPPRLRSVVLENGGRRQPYQAWVAVDLIPRMRGGALLVFHQPVIDPAQQPDAPIDPEVGTWLEHAEPAAWSALQEERERARVALSLVLTRAGIDSPAELEAQVDRHVDEVTRTFGLEALVPPPGDVQLMDKIRDAQRWLVLAQREPAFRPQARDAWAHCVEELLASLAARARPLLERWKGASQHSVPTEQEAEDRLIRFGLRHHLGPSYAHLRRSGTDRDLARKLDPGAAGAGASITLWLLPLLLLQTDAARDYARHIRLATESHPRLFEDLDQLVALRNYTFHEGRTRVADHLVSDLPEHTGNLFLATFAALHVGMRD